MNTEKWHGTGGGYTNHACRCPECTEAWRLVHADWERRHREERNAYMRAYNARRKVARL